MWYEMGLFHGCHLSKWKRIYITEIKALAINCMPGPPFEMVDHHPPCSNCPKKWALPYFGQSLIIWVEGWIVNEMINPNQVAMMLCFFDFINFRPGSCVLFCEGNKSTLSFLSSPLVIKHSLLEIPYEWSFQNRTITYCISMVHFPASHVWVPECQRV